MLTVCTETELVPTRVLSSYVLSKTSFSPIFRSLFFSPHIQQHRVPITCRRSHGCNAPCTDQLLRFVIPVMFLLPPRTHSVSASRSGTLTPLSFRSSPRTSALAVGERETALGSPPCGHRAHTYTHIPLSRAQESPGRALSLSRFFPLASEPQYQPLDHPGGAGSETIGRKPITHTKLLLFPPFYVCCVPPTHRTHTCTRFPLLLSRLPCIQSTLVCVCVFSRSLFRFHGAQNFGTLRLNFPDLLSFDSAN